MRTNTTRDGGSKQGSATVRKTTATPEERAEKMRYQRNLVAFIERVQEQRGEALTAQDKSIQDVIVSVEPGRRFDTIKLTIVRARQKTETLFFVDKTDGTIYGKKSEVAYNPAHWFDTIYNSRRWDWSLEFPEPKKSFRDEYEEGRGYGGYKHFRPKAA